MNAVISAAVHEYRNSNTDVASDRYVVTVNGTDYRTAVSSSGAVTAAAAPAEQSIPTQAAGNTPIPSPVAGTVIRYMVNEGDKVSPGDTVIIIESMKMELEIKATVSGTVHCLAAPGAHVAAQEILAEILTGASQ
ncbi:hypothetical protein JFL75_16395 [Breznakiella homolactica]|uniref:Biotin/lipoyl-binding protein n=1 Tax=Breznakiella homolactica TaxID=2798577 RepID=A0A7T8BCG9_9SPIR|nr:hypothetical protein JFL75_16395 [Breznakiella homolactica]